MKMRFLLAPVLATAITGISIAAYPAFGAPAQAAGHEGRIDLAGVEGYPLSGGDFALVRSAVGVFDVAPISYGTPAQLARKPILYVFMDPNCKFCHRFYEQVMPLVRKNAVQIRAIMVGFVKPSSLGKAAAIEKSRVVPTSGVGAGLEAANALAGDEYAFNTARESGGMTRSRNPQALAVIKAHNALLERLATAIPHGRMEVPAIVTLVRGKPVIFFGSPSQGAAAFVSQLNH